jgi:hypothetical protein
MFCQFALADSFATGFLFWTRTRHDRFGSVWVTSYSLSTVNYLSFGPLQPYWSTKFGLNLIFGSLLVAVT